MTNVNQASSNGRFCWHELHTADPRRAARFYGELVGWKAREVDMGPAGPYTTLSIGDRDVGGIARAAAGSAPHWLPYCVATEVDATLKKVRELGGTVEAPATDVPGVGRFGIVRDPEGARLGAIRLLEDRPDTEERPAVGTFCWTELLALDPAAATRFYQGLFAYGIETKDMGPMGPYNVLLRGTQMTGGVMKNPVPGAPACWLSYVAVDKVDPSAQRAEKLGGQIMMAPADIPGIGRFAVVRDPEGAAIALFTGAGA